MEFKEHSCRRSHEIFSFTICSIGQQIRRSTVRLKQFWVSVGYSGLDPVIEDIIGWISGHLDSGDGDPPDSGPSTQLALHVDDLLGQVHLQPVHRRALRVVAMVAHRLAQLRLEEADQLDVTPHVLSLKEEVVGGLGHRAEPGCHLLLFPIFIISLLLILTSSCIFLRARRT